MSDDKDEENKGGKNDDVNSAKMSDEQLREVLAEKGWTETKAFVEPGTPVVPKRAAAATRSADAERKAREREELQREGWRQHNVLAPDDPVAREFLSAAAQRIKSKKVLRALRAALDDPEVVTISRKVRRLRGDAGDQVRKLLGL